MPIVADTVPALVHIALFLFFLGLVDFLFNVNTSVAIATVAPIAVCALLYLLTIIAPVVNPQSPYQTSLSAFLWYIVQKLSAQRAMGGSEDRKMRDARGIRWLIGSLTEDSENEPFVLSIPGAFKTKWGRDVFVALEAEGAPSGPIGSASQENSGHITTRSLIRIPSVPSDHPHTIRPSFAQAFHSSFRNRRGPSLHQQTARPPALPPGQHHILRDVCRRVGCVIETYNTPPVSLPEDVKRRNLVAAIDAAAWLVCSTNTPLEWFGSIEDLCEGFNYVFRIAILNDKKVPGFVADYPLFVRCGCLGLVALKESLGRAPAQKPAHELIAAYTQARGNVGNDSQEAKGGFEVALANAQRIDMALNTAWDILQDLHEAIGPADANLITAQTARLLRPRESLISQLESFQSEGEQLRHTLDQSTHAFKVIVASLAENLFYNLPFGRNVPSSSLPFSRILEIHDWGKKIMFWPRFMTPGGMVSVLSSFAPDLRKAMAEQRGPLARHFRKPVATILRDFIAQMDPVLNNRHLVEQQLWRVQDLHDGGLGYSIEIFFAQVISFSGYAIRDSMSAELHQTIYVNTFAAIVSGWENYTKSLGTQHLLLNLVCELLGTRGGFRALGVCPSYLIDELLGFVGDYFRGVRGPHIDSILEELERCAHDDFRNKAMRVLSQPSYS
ncbi:hypothetical protein BC834DRAFT_973528 [Gloeopeniophorella convolvens]|nr:hypothetical protein BC834DRAFT_973528 [Gloeopeniophorella convolvens]